LLARKSLLIVLSKVASGVLSMVCFVFIMRFIGLGSEDAVGVYGTIVMAMSFVAAFTFIADLGFGMAHLKRVSEGHDLGKCVGTYAAVRLALTGMMVAVILSSIAVWKIFLHGSFSYAINENIVYLFVLYFVFFNISSIVTSTFDARTETAKSQLSAIMEPLVRTPFIIIICVATFIPADRDVKTYYLAFAYLAGIAATLIASLLLFRNYRIKRPDRETFRLYGKFALPFVVISVIAVIVAYADKLIIGYFRSNVEVGQYAGAQAIILNLYFISIAVGYVLFPTMSAHYARREIKRIRTLTYQAERYVSMIITPISLFIIVFAEEILQLLNTSLVPAANAFRVLAITMIFSSIGTQNGYQVLAFGRTDLTLKTNIMQVCITMVGFLLLIPDKIFNVRLAGMGILGAAVAYFIGVFVSFLFAKYFAWTLTKTRFKPCLVVHLVSASIMAILLYSMKYYLMDFNRWYELLGLFGMGTGIYLGLLYALKEFDKKDIQFLLDTINPSKMKKYVSSEIKRK
jgi:O-antigen/teichoic acid export membrane protein